MATAGLTFTPVAEGAVCNFVQETDIVITDGAAASPYPSSINVSGLPRGITDVNVTLSSWHHDRAADVNVLLVGPTGQSVVLISDVGDTSPVSGVDLTLDDQAATGVPVMSPVTSGRYVPTNFFGDSDDYPDPAPDAVPAALSLAGFNGTDPNGGWHLYVFDDNALGGDGDFGGWSIQITTVDTPGAPIISTPTNGLDSDGDFIVAGTAQAGSTVKVYEGTTLLSETTTSATGTWALVLLDQEHRVHAYTATATDAFGNVSAASAVKTVAVDTEHPRVIRTKPGAGADEVRRGRNVRAFFSEPVRSVTIVGANVKLVRSATGATVRARIRYDADTKSVIINPRNDLAANARYQVVVGTGVRDRAGNRLDQNTARSGNQAKTWRFTTR